jgi:tRNA 2-thiouridine synthesizing protein B
VKTLHLFSSSPFQYRALQSAIPLLAEYDALLLMGDASYAMHAEEVLKALPNSIKCFVLQDDAEARDIATKPHFELVSYARFVELCVIYDKVQSW